MIDFCLMNSYYILLQWVITVLLPKLIDEYSKYV